MEAELRPASGLQPLDLPRLEVRPSVVIELCYAYYHVLRHGRPLAPLPWQRELLEHPPQWVLDAATAAKNLPGYEALLLACAFGYDADETPDRFLTELPGLPARLLAEFEAVFDVSRYEDLGDDASSPLERLRAAFDALDAPRTAELAANLTQLWGYLQVAWEVNGAEVTSTASQRLVSALGPTSDLVAALPAHHFVNFEDSRADIRSHQRQGPTLVVPLYFATRGGFKFVVRQRLCLGYGVRSEDFYREQKDDVTRLASRLKAFSDPTRLLLLFQVARLARFPLTVGDLARQLNVSQPTASGHLRLLRELQLVQVVRRGNRSYYRLDPGAVREILAELEKLLIPSN